MPGTLKKDFKVQENGSWDLAYFFSDSSAYVTYLYLKKYKALLSFLEKCKNLHSQMSFKERISWIYVIKSG